MPGLGTGKYNRKKDKIKPEDFFVGDTSRTFKNWHIALLLLKAIAAQKTSQKASRNQMVKCLVCRVSIVHQSLERHLNSHLPPHIKALCCPYDECHHTTSAKQTGNMNNHIRVMHTKEDLRCEVRLQPPGGADTGNKVYVCAFANPDASAVSRHKRAHQEQGLDVKLRIPKDADMETVWAVPCSQNKETKNWSFNFEDARQWVAPPTIERPEPKLHIKDLDEVHDFPTSSLPRRVNFLAKFVPRPRRGLPRRAAGQKPSRPSASLQNVGPAAETVESDDDGGDDQPYAEEPFKRDDEQYAGEPFESMAVVDDGDENHGADEPCESSDAVEYGDNDRDAVEQSLHEEADDTAVKMEVVDDALPTSGNSPLPSRRSRSAGYESSRSPSPSVSPPPSPHYIESSRIMAATALMELASQSLPCPPYTFRPAAAPVSPLTTSPRSGPPTAPSLCETLRTSLPSFDESFGGMHVEEHPDWKTFSPTIAPIRPAAGLGLSATLLNQRPTSTGGCWPPVDVPMLRPARWD